MDVNDLARLGYDKEGLAPGIDYVPDVITGDGVETDFVERAQRRATELNAMGGVSILGGPLERLDQINLALDDGVDLETAVQRFGDEGQIQRVRGLVAVGEITGSGL